ncbi:MAG TPA: hypothetical protein VF796_09515 [Humisphaera sp.]
MFSGRRIKAPERGLLAMHPFVDVLEGRSLFSAVAHDGVVDVDAVVDVPAREGAGSPWSTRAIGSGAAVEADDDDGTAALVVRTTPGQVEVKPATPGSAFASGRTIGDTNQTLFENVVWDRRGKLEPVPLPTDEQIAAARAAGTGRTYYEPDESGNTDSPFATGRTLTGAMAPYLTMRAPQVAHLFAA